MNYLIRRDPFREMMTLRSAMDRLFDTAFLGEPGEPGEWPSFVDTLPLDVTETEDEYFVKASIPGIQPDDMEITYSGKTLTIKGEYKAEARERRRALPPARAALRCLCPQPDPARGGQV